MWLILLSRLIIMNNNVLCLKLCYNHHILKITWTLLIVKNHYVTMLYMNTNVFKKENYTNMLVSVTTSKNSKIFLKPLWFLLLTDSSMKAAYFPWHQHQSRNQVLEYHCVFSLTYYMWKRKMLPIDSDIFNQSASQLNLELHLGNLNQGKQEIQK